VTLTHGDTAARQAAARLDAVLGKHTVYNADTASSRKKLQNLVVIS